MKPASNNSTFFCAWILPILFRLAGTTLFSSASLYFSFRALHSQLGINFSSSPAVYGASVTFVLSQCVIAAKSELDICVLLLSIALFELVWNFNQIPFLPILPTKGSFLLLTSVGSDGQRMTLGDSLVFSTALVLAPLVWFREVFIAILDVPLDVNLIDEGELDRQKSFIALITLLGGTSVSFVLLLLSSSILLQVQSSSQAFFSLLFYTIVLGIPAFIEYPLLWKCLREEPFRWAIRFSIGPSKASLDSFAFYLISFWAISLVLVLFISFIMLKIRLNFKYQAIARKIFHAVVVLLFVPAPIFGKFPGTVLLGFAFSVAFKVLVAVELGRVFHLLSKKALFPSILWSGVTTLVDSFEEIETNSSESTNKTLDESIETEKNRFVLGHILLLLGCATPVWLTIVANEYSRLPKLEGSLLLLSLSGIVSVGLGDAAAAIIGTIAKVNYIEHRWGPIFQYAYDNTFGTLDPADHDWQLDGSTETLSSSSENNPPSVMHQDPASSISSSTIEYRWPGHNKTVEGTAGFILCAFVSTILIASISGINELSSGLFVSIAIVSIFSALVETFINAADNLIVPLASWSSLFVCLHIVDAIKLKGFVEGLVSLVNVESQEL